MVRQPLVTFENQLDPLAACGNIRRAFGGMAMSDEETAALIAGGHTFGKAHGARKPEGCLVGDPGEATIENQGLGWKNKCGKGHSEDTISSGLEGAWTAAPTAWTTQYLDNLYGFEWVQTKSPAGAIQWVPKDPAAANLVPDAHRPDVRHAPIMFTTDLALREDPGFRKITQRWRKNPQLFADAFARAWFKLTHRDLGPEARYVGKDVPKVSFVWQDPLPKADYAMIGDADIAKLKGDIAASGLTVPELVRAAWASASTYRGTDMRGGANGARLRLDPQRGWAVNDPAELAKVVAKLDAIRTQFNKDATGGKKVSLADLVVLGGSVAIEQAAKAAGHDVTVPFTPGRVDATQAQTDAASFAHLEPKADGFRNYYSAESHFNPVEALIDKADNRLATRGSGGNHLVPEFGDKGFQLHRDQGFILDHQHRCCRLFVDFGHRTRHQSFNLFGFETQDVARFFRGEIFKRRQKQRLAMLRGNDSQARMGRTFAAAHQVAVAALDMAG